jgi:hypothetical protein
MSQKTQKTQKTKKTEKNQLCQIAAQFFEGQPRMDTDLHGLEPLRESTWINSIGGDPDRSGPMWSDLEVAFPPGRSSIICN